MSASSQAKDESLAHSLLVKMVYPSPEAGIVDYVRVLRALLVYAAALIDCHKAPIVVNSLQEYLHAVDMRSAVLYADC